MSPISIALIIGVYFVLLVVIARITGAKADTQTFFTANRQSPWYLVAFGMIGASLSGVTFISVPGWVQASSFSYMQMVLGYLVGYAVIALVLMPLYYKYNVISIYSYLDNRFGVRSYKTGAFFFLISRTIGAAFRLFLVAGVLQLAIFDQLNIPFPVSVAVTIVLIWIYTFRGGIKTIVFTDTLQTFFMLSSVILSIYLLNEQLGWSLKDMTASIRESSYSETFFWDWKDSKHFFKQFFSGAFIAIVMTGLDQDMMQKNLTCKTLKDAQKNMFWFSIVLVFANLIFMCLGALLYLFATEKGLALPNRADDLFPYIALNFMGPLGATVFILGIIAAAYSSADSALTSLTTSFCTDFLNIKGLPESRKHRLRVRVHIGFSVLLFIVIVIFRVINDDSVIANLFRIAGYTYGPLLGLFAFGILTKYDIRDRYVPIVCVLSVAITKLLSDYDELLFNGFNFGFELLIVNGGITFLGLLALRIKSEA